MTLLEQTYMDLRAAGLTDCAEAFSRDYLCKNKNWYAFQTHTGRDFSVAAAVQCLRSLRSRQTTPGLLQAQRKALAASERALLLHLNDAYMIAEIVHTVS
jgi:hypothetical protein